MNRCWNESHTSDSGNYRVNSLDQCYFFLFETIELKDFIFDVTIVQNYEFMVNVNFRIGLVDDEIIANTHKNRNVVFYAQQSHYIDLEA